MRVLAEIRWCETHKQSTDSDETCYGFFDRRVNPCVVVDAQVTRKDECPDCDGDKVVPADCGCGGDWDGRNHVCDPGDTEQPCPSCSVEPKQTEQNIERAADIIRRSTVRTSDLISIGGGRMGIRE